MKTTIEQLRKNKGLFEQLLNNVDKDMILWKPLPDKWCLLEIVCHLYDEEREDFRFRAKWVLEKPNTLPPPFNPLEWVEAHEYMKQDYEDMVTKFLKEREQSIAWLQSLKDPQWDNYYMHPKLGKTTAQHYVDNWLAHDYLHIRQLLKLKFDYLKHHSGNSLEYAGIW